MKLLIAGSRSIKAFNFSEYVADNVDLIICGGADGIDAIAESYADKKRISKLVLRPCYKLYGRAAPLKRNEQMVDMADAVLIVWDGVSKGTAYTVNYAKKCLKPITVIISKKESQ